MLGTESFAGVHEGIKGNCSRCPLARLAGAVTLSGYDPLRRFPWSLSPTAGQDS
jgi:hypothetical protein